MALFPVYPKGQKAFDFIPMLNDPKKTEFKSRN